MRAVISFVFFDTEENERHECTMQAFESVMQTDPRHVIIAIDNGSTDPRSYQAISNYDAKRAFAWAKIPEPQSTAYGVNTGWKYFEDSIQRGTSVAVKYDSDIVMPDGLWVEDMLHILAANPDIGLIGPKNPGQKYFGTWRTVDHNGWFETTFVYGAVVARSPAAFRAIGYMKQPLGRWGWDDHYDTHRIKVAGLKLATLENHTWKQISKKSCLPEDEKRVAEGQRAVINLMQQVTSGSRALYEPFYGYDPGRGFVQEA